MTPRQKRRAIWRAMDPGVWTNTAIIAERSGLAPIEVSSSIRTLVHQGLVEQVARGVYMRSLPGQALPKQLVCKRGHDVSEPDAVIFVQGARQCRVCYEIRKLREVRKQRFSPGQPFAGELDDPDPYYRLYEEPLSEAKRSLDAEREILQEAGRGRTIEALRIGHKPFEESPFAWELALFEQMVFRYSSKHPALVEAMRRKVRHEQGVQRAEAGEAEPARPPDPAPKARIKRRRTSNVQDEAAEAEEEFYGWLFGDAA